MAEFDHPEVTLSDWQDFKKKIQLLTNYSHLRKRIKETADNH